MPPQIKAVGYIRLKECHHLFTCIEWCKAKSFDFHVDEYRLQVYLFDPNAFMEVATFISKVCDNAAIINIK